MKSEKNIIIISASSDIGIDMCKQWVPNGWNIFGTYRTKTKAVEDIENSGVKMLHCDLSDNKSIQDACSELKKVCPKWDIIIMGTGAQEPVGPIVETNFDEWEQSVKINFMNQIRIAHELLPNRNVNNEIEPGVFFFAGGGTNNATVNYSAYTISKIALIKMCELFDAEIPDTRFAIVGPGWVKTKIHEATLKAGEKAGDSYNKTKEKLASDECTPVEKVIECFEWIMDSPRELISGRNFSVIFDKWGTDELDSLLKKHKDMYKLRRYGNEFLVGGDATKKSSELIKNLIVSLPTIHEFHSPLSDFYSYLKTTLRKEVELLFSNNQNIEVEFNPFGNLVFPYQSMGNIDSLNLFDLDEIIIFSFYWTNRKRYKKVLDIGANLGLHSILMSKCGYDVSCFEPDPFHFEIIQRNLSLNKVENVQTNNCAVSFKNGEMEFTRVLGNTTASHLTGAKENPYGDLECFKVKVVDFRSLLEGVDLVKIDVEGHEKEIFLKTELKDWQNLDALAEVESEQNAEAVFNHFNKIGVNLFAQKINWNKVNSLSDMPTTYKEGMLFISCKDEMPW